MQESTDSCPGARESAFARQWHHRPPVPIQVSPFFTWPPDPLRALRWIADRWLTIAENSLLLVLATVSWLWFQPSLEETKTFAFAWVAEIYLRNLVLLLVVAGGLHLYFYSWKRQGDRLKHDRRDLATKSRAFTFKDQVRDNIFWSLGSGVAFWTAHEALMF